MAAEKYYAQSDLGTLVSELSQDSTKNILPLFVLSRIIGDQKLIEQISAAESTALVLPGPSTDLTKASQQVQAIQSQSLAGERFVFLNSKGRPDLPKSIRMTDAKRIGRLRVFFVTESQALWDHLAKGSSKAPQPTTTIPKKVADDFPETQEARTALLNKSLTDLRFPTAYRTPLDPAPKPYKLDILDAVRSFAPKAKEADLSFYGVTTEAMSACEVVFYEQMYQGLLSELDKSSAFPKPKHPIVGQSQSYPWKQIALQMPRYFRQAVGYSYDGHDYIYLKFRRHISGSEPAKGNKAEPLPRNDREYHVHDGGANYFEFHCELKAKRIFKAYVHGEA